MAGTLAFMFAMHWRANQKEDKLAQAQPIAALSPARPRLRPWPPREKELDEETRCREGTPRGVLVRGGGLSEGRG